MMIDYKLYNNNDKKFYSLLESIVRTHCIFLPIKKVINVFMN